MSVMLTSVVLLVALALLFDFTNGFHDAANSISTVVATRAMSARAAVVFSALCNFAALFFIGEGVANTVAKTVHPGSATLTVTFGALIAAISWNLITWHVGMPSSSSHAVIGGLVGAGLAAGGVSAVNWASVQKVAIFIVVSPLLAFTVAVLGTLLVQGLQKLLHWRDNGKPFKALQLVSAAWVSFGHGANDAQKTMGIIAALLVGTGHLTATADGTIQPPQWVAIGAYAAIAAGTAWGGWRIVQTMGLKLTRLNAKSAVGANIGAVVSIFTATTLSVPISTTHAAAASVVGAGVGSRRGANWRVVGEMVIAWVVTIPVTALLGWLVFRLAALPGVLGVTATVAITVVFAVGVVIALRQAFGADDLAAEIPSEEDLDGTGAAAPIEAAVPAGTATVEPVAVVPTASSTSSAL